MKFIVLTTFPELVQPVFEHGIVRRAVEAGIVQGSVVNLRDFTDDKHKTTDDMPYGGGPGMVMLCEPIFSAVAAVRAEHGPLPLLFMSPAGELLTQSLARELATGVAPARPGDATCKEECREEEGRAGATPTNTPAPPGYILLCGRYEGVDQRVVDHLVDREISIGDYVLSGGELAAMVVVDAVARLLPGVLGNSESAGQESFAEGLLDWPHYTRPEDFRGYRVPEVLLSGHHGKISGFRADAALLLTYARRPDLLSSAQAARAEAILASRRQKDED